MAKKMPEYLIKLREYLFQESERNEDLVLSYFRKIFGTAFKRQSDLGAVGTDGYVPGHFVLEIKGDKNDWYSGLIQGLAYENRGLSFSIVVVVAKHFLGIWQKKNISSELLKAIRKQTGAPSAIGKRLAKEFSAKKKEILKSALWYRPHLFEGLFEADLDAWSDALNNFEKTLKENQKIRQKITLKNFVSKLEEMKGFFDRTQPIKTVRAFYSMIYGPWNENSVVHLDPRNQDRATLGGSVITDLRPDMRDKFKEFVDNHVVFLDGSENFDDFFSRYDEALDSVDKEFRIRNGIFFTDLDLSKFVMWLVKQHIPNLGRNYIVIDPACGSGNLVTNWRSPLELRHKIVSEIEPELLFAVEQRMKGDQWHNGKFTVVPKVSENKGLNFLDIPATKYLEILKAHLKEKGRKPDKPLAFLCNPPYRSDEDQTASAKTYQIDPSLINLVGQASGDRYCYFLAQMKLICKTAEDSGYPDESVLLLFTKSAWLTNRKDFQQIRREIFGSYEDVAAILINSNEFFDVKGKFPIAFTIWKFRGENVNLDPNRSIPLIDLTWLKKDQLNCINWLNLEDVDNKCEEIFKNPLSISIRLGIPGQNIKEWSGQKSDSFKRQRRKIERDVSSVGGLPKGDSRHSNRSAYGESQGSFIGFMDDLTLCRINKDTGQKPWFRLNNQFMDVRKTRCFSGPATHFSFTPINDDVESAQKLFFWYALGRIFSSEGYPMWADALELWPINLEGEKGKLAIEYSFALAFAENECVETTFPAGNPVKDAIEVVVSNPMSPLNPESFWSKLMLPIVKKTKIPSVKELLEKTNLLFEVWKNHLRGKNEVTPSYQKSYFVGIGKLRSGAGIVQIKDYANETHNEKLMKAHEEIQKSLKNLKKEFHQFIISPKGLSYFSGGQIKSYKSQILEFIPKTKFDLVLEKRLALSGYIISRLISDPNFGLTKFVKVFYLADSVTAAGLKTEYHRQAAGPLDPRALYNPNVGILPMGERHGYFKIGKRKNQFRFIAGPNFKALLKKSNNLLANETKKIDQILKLLKELNTDQSEIVATIYACWNDLIIEEKNITDEMIIKEFLKNWHLKKKRFSETKLLKAIKWMKLNSLVPGGKGAKTAVKIDNIEIPEGMDS